MSKSHSKSDRLKNPVRHEENRQDRHYFKDLLREAPLEELEDLEDYEPILPWKEATSVKPAEVKPKFIRRDKFQEG